QAPGEQAHHDLGHDQADPDADGGERDEDGTAGKPVHGFTLRARLTPGPAGKWTLAERQISSGGAWQLEHHVVEPKRGYEERGAGHGPAHRAVLRRAGARR